MSEPSDEPDDGTAGDHTPLDQGAYPPPQNPIPPAHPLETPYATDGKEPSGQNSGGPEPEPTPSGPKDQKASNERQAPLTPEERWTIADMHIQGVPQNKIVVVYGEGRKESIRKIIREVDSGAIVKVQGRWVKKESAMQSEISLIGESAEAQAAKGVIVTVAKSTKDDAVILAGRKLEIGEWVLNKYSRAADRTELTVQQLIEQSVSFWFTHHDNVDLYYLKWKAGLDYADGLEKRIEKFEREKEQWKATNNYLAERIIHRE